MIYDPTQWRPFRSGEAFYPSSRRGSYRLEKPAALYVVGEGDVRQLVGYGTDFKVELPRDGYQIVASAAGVEHSPELAVTHPAGPILTNMDKRPMASPLERAVTLGLRALNRKKRELQALVAEANAKLKPPVASPSAAPAEPAVPPAEPVPAPEADPAS